MRVGHETTHLSSENHNFFTTRHVLMYIIRALLNKKDKIEFAQFSLSLLIILVHRSVGDMIK